MVRFCFMHTCYILIFSGKFKLTYYSGAGSCGAVAAFFVSLGRQWCCGGDTLGHITQLERRLFSKEVSFYKSLNYNNLKRKITIQLSGVLLGTFFAFVPAEASAVLQIISSI